MLPGLSSRAATARRPSWPALGLVLLAAALVAGAVQASSRHYQRPLATDYVPEWTQLGLEGGTVTAITRSPDGRLWAGGLHAPFGSVGRQEPFLVVSADLGANWSLVDADDLPGSIFPNPSFRPATASDGTRLLLMADRALRWNEQNNGWTQFPRPTGTLSRPIVTFTVARGSTPYLLLGLGLNDIGIIQYSPELVAIDVAQGDARVVTPMQAVDMEPTALAISDLHSDTWAAAFESPGGGALLTTSTNAGQAWTTLPLPAAGRITALAWQEERLLAAVERVGLFALEAGAWQRVDDGDRRLRRVRVLEVSPHDSNQVFAAGPSGLSRSAGAAGAWTHAVDGTGRLNVSTIYADPSDPDMVFIGAFGEAVLASDDGGASFFPASGGIAAAAVLEIDSNPTNPRHLVLVQARKDGAAIRESFDAGASWSLALPTPVEPGNVGFGHDGALWMLGKRGSDPLDMRLYRRDGQRWVRAGLPVPARGRVLLEFIQRGEAPGTLYAGGGGTSDAIDGTALAWRSLDDGRTWSLLWDEPSSFGRLHTTRSLVEMPGFDAHELVIDRFARDESSTRPVTWRSSDAGASWSRLTVSGAAELAADRWLCADPDQPKRLISMLAFGFGQLTEIELDSGVGWQPMEGRLLSRPTAFACWFGEGGLRYVAATITFPGVFYGREGSDGQPAQAIGEWPVRQTTAVHRWAGGLLLGTDSGLWRAAAEEAFDAPELVSATDAGARMTINARLAWTGGAPWVRVLRDGEEVAWIENTGEWSARLLRQSLSPSEYTVCNGFDENCSEPMMLVR